MPVVVVVGNCIAEAIVDGLTASRAAARFRFAIIPIHLQALHDPGSVGLLAEASHVFVQQFDDIDMSAVDTLIAPGCAVHKFPSFALHSLWPFDTANGYCDDIAQTMPQDRIRHFDGALAALRQLEPDKKKRIARYRDLDFPLAAKIDAVAKTQARFLQLMDERAGSSIGRFIERHQRDRQLFHSTHHPTDLVFHELCEECLSRLGAKDTIVLRPEANGWRDWSVPVHPAIARRLGVVWAHEATRYRYFSLGDITWKDWVEAYVDTFG